MIPDRLTVVPNLPTGATGNSSLQLELTRNHRLREITLADEVRDDINVFDRAWIKQKDRVAEARFLFPKCALHIGKNASSPDFGRMRQGRRARIRIRRRTMADN